MECRSVRQTRTYPVIKDSIGHSVETNNTPRRGLSITIDDGPSENTLTMLHMLQRARVPASFFMLGNRIARFPEVARAVSDSNYDICVHGMDHSDITTVSTSALLGSLKHFDKLAHRHGIKYRKIFRPSFGELSTDSISALIENGYRIVLWSLDSHDWKSSYPTIRNHIYRQTNLHKIALFHDNPVNAPGYSPDCSLRSIAYTIALCRKRHIPITTLRLRHPASAG